MSQSLITSLTLIAGYHGINLDYSELKNQFSDKNGYFGVTQWILAAKKNSLHARLVEKSIDRLKLISLPALVLGKEKEESFILLKSEDDKYLIYNIKEKSNHIFDKNEFNKIYSGKIILVSSKKSVTRKLQRFDFTWFIPYIIKYRNIFIEILALSIFIQFFALITPLFFQVVMDKVLVHQSYNTLDVIAFSFIVVVLFDVILTGLRTYLFSHTTNRIDIELGSKLLSHIINLPIRYFEVRRVGDTIARIKEQENIRQFLTGQAFTSLLDVMFSFLFIIVMWYYCPPLTLIVLASLPLYIILSLIVSPILRRRLDNQFARNADNQAFLVETVSTVSTLKSLAAERQIINRWHELLPAYVSSAMKVTRLAILGQQGVQLIQKVGSVIILWFGAHLVISNEITVGQLIAFNMLASQVTSPIIRLAQLWQDFQQTGISVARLGDILNTPVEHSESNINLSSLRGQIKFEDVGFRYQTDGKWNINNLSLNIKAEEVIGIVGRSGSGKSTLTKLIQRFYIPEKGRIMLDELDIALAGPTWLRRHIGVVQQENVLLNRTIKENIALTQPAASLELIIHACQQAGAHDFIMQLPKGYDTQISEQGIGLSGGQRQRVALARVLLNNPKILILDEATSALDYESEKAIIDNMPLICKNRTVIIITHRLSTVRHANRIIVMNEGTIVEQGSHNQLINIENGIYRKMSELV
ncbi:type I secretion system permease/ATPase [Xenorhabdus sp. Reich]|uniref:Alpha-hemolysin translocation ATP-binding protein HlyB n=1 Tax=Xenorhabdus littoralis TaxID=2582835 RepID=A0ABU4SNJ3_9GAMM|nr:type I secretion system permease/ATPase [Xenorhabdus sp. Reich]MDX8000207.1 type I secretion system permease/ATPase [Xenorhabdus sp. Reich]